MLKSFDDADVFITKPIKGAKNVVIAVEGEHGCAPLLALSGFIGAKEPHAHFVSRFMRQDSINTLPDPEDPGWPIYKIGETLVVLIRSYHTPESLGMHSQTMWTYYYPVLRGLALVLESFGVKQMEFLNVTYAHELIPDEMFEQLSNEEVVVYDLNEDSQKDGPDIFLHSPAWLTTWIFTRLRYKSHKAKITSIGWDAEGFIDDVAMSTLAQYLSDTYGWTFNAEVYEDVKSELLEAQAFEDEMIRNAFSQLPTNKKPDGVMFG